MKNIVPNENIKWNSKREQFREDIYLIRGYSNNKKTLTMIDSFVQKNLPTDLNNLEDYYIDFLKESKETNIKHIKAYPKVITQYSMNNDLVIMYWWMKGKFIASYKYKDGLRLQRDSKEVKIGPAPEM